MTEKQTAKQLESTAQAASDITLQGKGDLGHILSTNSADGPSMQGFDAKFSDIIDYIIKVTHEIWEERGIGRLYDYYGTNMRIHTSDGDIYSREKVIESTIQSLAAFPDRRLYGDEVIWTGDGRGGFYTSHRLTHEGHNWGHTAYGPPTGRKVSYRAIADCHVVDNVIVEEWLVRDELSLIHQLGFDVQEMARKLAAMETRSSQLVTVPAEAERLRGQLPPESFVADGGSEVENFVRRAFHEIWNWRLLNKIRDYYGPKYICDSASGRQFYGRNQFANYILSLLSPFPDLALSVDHFCALEDGAGRYRTATRWSMAGTHTGPGVYGRPTGKQIQIMGISHHLIENGCFVQEWTVFDEFALLKQLYRPEEKNDVV